MNEQDADKLSHVFSSQLPKMDKTEFNVEVQSMGDEAAPVVITQSEYMRRMKDMSRYQSGMAFYGQMPDMFQFVLNSDHPLVKRVLSQCSEATEQELHPVLSELKGLEARLAVLKQEADKKKADELTQEEKDDRTNTEKAIQTQKDKKNEILANYAKGNQIVHQLIDLALLQNGMLKGAALSQFLKRSIDLIK
mgnify:CR=1 FL=1